MSKREKSADSKLGKGKLKKEEAFFWVECALYLKRRLRRLMRVRVLYQIR